MTESQAVRLSTPSNLVHKLYKYKKKKRFTSKFLFQICPDQILLGQQMCCSGVDARSFPRPPALCSPINQVNKNHSINTQIQKTKF